MVEHVEDIALEKYSGFFKHFGLESDVEYTCHRVQGSSLDMAKFSQECIQILKTTKEWHAIKSAV
jgi:hypothetical protein